MRWIQRLKQWAMQVAARSLITAVQHSKACRLVLLMR